MMRRKAECGLQVSSVKIKCLLGAARANFLEILDNSVWDQVI